MLIVCPSCASRYSIADEKIGAEGRNVRCGSCRSDWFVKLDEGIASASAAEDIVQREQAGEAGESPASASSEGFREAELDPALNDLFDQEMERARQDAEAAEALRRKKERFGWLKRMAGFFRRSKRNEALTGTEPVRHVEEVTPPIEPPALAMRRPVGAVIEHEPARRPRAARAGPLKTLGRALKGPAGLGLASALAFGAIIVERERIAFFVPKAASAYAMIGLPVNPAGLAFASLETRLSRDGETRVLLVEGTVNNVAAELKPVPRIELRVRSGDGRTLYTWTTDPPRRSLRPGEALHFRTRLATPPEAGRDVEVRFAGEVASASASR